MAVVFEDTFTEASDTVLESHTPDTGTGWTKLDTIGMTVDAAGDFVNADSDSGGVSSAYTADYTVGDADYDVEWDFLSEGTGGDDSAGVIARRTDDVNHWTIMIRNVQAVDAFLIKRVASTRTTVASADTDNVWTAETLKYELRGSTHKLFFGATEELSATDTAFENDLTGGGLYTGDYADAGDDTDVLWHFDNFKITEVAAGGDGIPLAMHHYKQMRACG